MLGGFLVLLALALYGIGERLAGPRLGALAALVAATSTGAVHFSREYIFALPAAAMLACAVYLLIRSDGLRLRRWAVACGAALGLMLLARSMTIAFVPGCSPPGPSACSPAAPTTSARRLVNLGLLVATGAAVAATWYAPNMTTVVDYLTGYGYGDKSRAYGDAGTLVSWGRLRSPFVHMSGEDLLLPLAAILVAGLARGRGGGRAPGPARRRSTGNRSTAWPPPTRSPWPSSPSPATRRWPAPATAASASRCRSRSCCRPWRSSPCGLHPRATAPALAGPAAIVRIHPGLQPRRLALSDTRARGLGAGLRRRALRQRRGAGAQRDPRPDPRPGDPLRRGRPRVARCRPRRRRAGCCPGQIATGSCRSQPSGPTAGSSTRTPSSSPPCSDPADDRRSSRSAPNPGLGRRPTVSSSAARSSSIPRLLLTVSGNHDDFPPTITQIPDRAGRRAARLPPRRHHAPPRRQALRFWRRPSAQPAPIPAELKGSRGDAPPHCKPAPPVRAGALLFVAAFALYSCHDPAADRLRAGDRRRHRGPGPRRPLLGQAGLAAADESRPARARRPPLRADGNPAAAADGALLRRRPRSPTNDRPLRRIPERLHLPLVLQPLHRRDRRPRPLRARLPGPPLAALGRRRSPPSSSSPASPGPTRRSAWRPPTWRP